MDRSTPSLNRTTTFVLIFLLVPTVGAWSQAGGDAAHSGIWSDAPSILDVHGNLTLAKAGGVLDKGGPGVLSTPHGVIAMVKEGSTCRLISWNAGNTTALGSDMACGQGRLLAYDAGADLVIGCLDGSPSQPLLYAWDAASGSQAWAVGPSRSELDPAGILPLDLLSLSCLGAALDQGTLYVAFTDANGNHTIESLQAADGSRNWARSVPATEFFDAQAPAEPPESPVPLPVDPEGALSGTGGMVPQSITLSSTGLLVTGRLMGAGEQSGVPVAAWFSMAGERHGTAIVDSESVEADSLLPISKNAASHGPLVAAVFGQHLLVVDPSGSKAAFVPLGASSFGAEILAAPVWSSTALVVGGESSAFLFEGATSDPLRWGGHEGGRLQDLLLSGESAWGLVTADGANRTADLVRFDSADGDVLQRIPLNFTAPSDLGGHLTPLDGGRLMIWSRDGSGLLIGPPQVGGGPAFQVSNAYPALGETIELEVDLAEDEKGIVAWGDGLVQEFEGAMRLGHGYREPGQHRLIVTQMHRDGSTSSSASTIHVGGFPPEEPGLFEILFGPDNWELTVTILGAIVSGIGILLGFIGAYRGRHRLEHHLKALDRILDRGRSEPFRGVRDLHAYRKGLRKDLAKGRLQDAQYTVITNHATDILESLRERILGRFTGRVSQAFSHQLDLNLRDGRIDDSEANALLDLVEKEDLPTGDKERLTELVRSWQAIL